MSDTRPQIVVVEDAEEVREILALVLEQDGYSVLGYEAAEPAFESIRASRPALVLTDLMLGAESGLDLITRIRSDLAPPVPPIIACSGFTSFEQEALQRGASCFIPKPFELSTIREAVRSLITDGSPSKDTRALAGSESLALRRRAVEAAREALVRLKPRWPDLHQRCRWTADFFPRYYGFGEVFTAILHEDVLEVTAASDGTVWPTGWSVDLPLCRDVLETNSALIVPDLGSIGVTVTRPDGQPLRFFAGVPMANGPFAVGAICFVDRDPRRLDAGAFNLLAALGRRATSVLSASAAEVGPLWTPSGRTSREGLGLLLTAELSRMDRGGLSMGLFAFAGSPPIARLPARTLLAEIGDEQYALFMVRPPGPEGRAELFDYIDAIAHDPEFRAGGLVRTESGGAVLFDARALVRAAECLLGYALRGPPGTIERMVVQREALSEKEH